MDNRQGCITGIKIHEIKQLAIKINGDTKPIL